jgi:collagenase-like PrtC family protease
MKKNSPKAPAKDLPHGMAAINSGVDAVYIGAPQSLVRTLPTLSKMYALVSMHTLLTHKFCGYQHDLVR